ncbi:MAG: 3-deoxy-7-phosphoheptulonate synthase [Candidatus Latescibacteria bacterium]|nr:3-deoxy-7-phosphoheptulonate synthase [Candidatus Latescibacterota bacterium]
MVVVMHPQATEAQKEHVRETIRALGCTPRDVQGEEVTIICLIGNTRGLQPEQLEIIPGVDRVQRIQRPFKLVSREVQPSDSIIQVDGVEIGGHEVVVFAGPCSVESKKQLMETAHAVQKAGAKILRGGAFKPRTSPYSFQGLGIEGLKIMAEVKKETGLPVITEVMSPEMVPVVAEYADILQIGARNMQNYPLLMVVGKSHRPVMLKRGLSATIEEMLLAAEYVLAGGNHQVILCERGIRTFETWTRNTLDISAVPVLKRYSHLPVFIDPSQATGHAEYVSAVSCAAVAAGADGLIIEVHPNPEKALSDGEQSIRPEVFAELMPQLRAVAQAIGRTA